jgi:hypothetical protein
LERAALLFFATPIHGFFSMSISHDLTQTSGIILLVAIELRRLGKRNVTNVKEILFLSFILLLTVHSGPLIILLAILRNLWCLRALWTAATTIIMAILLYLTNLGLTPGLEVHGNFMETSQVKYYWMLSDLKCVLQHPEAEVSGGDWSVLEQIAPKSIWKTPLSCQNYDPQITLLDISKRDFDFGSLGFFGTYLSVTTKNPAVVAMAHIQRARGVLPPFMFQAPSNQVSLDVNQPIGQNTNTALQTGPELLHPSNDLPGEENSKPKIFNALEVPAQGAAFIFNQASWFWGWGGLWLTVIFLTLFNLFKKATVSKLVLALYAPISMHFVLLLVMPTSMPRYYMFSISLGILMLLVYSVRILSGRNEGEKTKFSS